MITATFRTLGLAAGFALVGASVANAGCIITAQNNATRDIPLGTCFNMSLPQDFSAFGTEACAGFTNVIHDPTWNDTIVKIGANQPASVGLLMDPIRNDESMTVTFSAPGERVLEERFSAKASVLYCY